MGAVLARERHGYELDARINARGLPIDMALVHGAIAAYERNVGSLVAEAQQITGLSNPNSVAQLLDWLRQQGLEAQTLDKAVVRDLLLTELAPPVRRLLEIRQLLGMTSVKKYHALRDRTSADGRLRDTLQYLGAGRTGRWAGRGLQLQNLPRGTLNLQQMHLAVERLRAGGDASMEELQSCIRASVRAPDGCLIAAADLASIESRVVAWLAEEETMLAVFKEGRDTYLDYGQQLLGKPETEITKAERTYCKPVVLGGAYQMGGSGLVAYAQGMGVEMSEEEAQDAVAAFRARYNGLPRLWSRLDEAAREVVVDGGRKEVGRLAFEMDPPWLFMVLPSGRRLAYLHPRIQMQQAPWGDDVPTMTYMGLNQFTKKWERQSTFGGRWTEQACQAVARDVLLDGLLHADAMGFELIGSVHDELLALVGDDNWLCHESLAHCMTRLPEWADSTLYLDAEGFSDRFYHK